MQNSLKKMLARMFADKKRQRRIVAVVCVLSVLVITSVFTELMQPVITLTPDPVCGQSEHAHSADCFENQLSCGIEESDEHAHSDDCYKSVMVCGKSEHMHVEACYPETIEEQTVTVIDPTEAPAETVEAPAVMSISEGESTEAPVEVTAEPTVEVTAEPSAEVTVEPTAEVTAEPTVEVTAEPAPIVAVTAVSADKVFVGQSVTWNISVANETELTYYIADETGMEIVSGTLDAGATCISWLADRTGVFTMTVTATNATGSVSANSTVTVEESEELVAAVLADSQSCFAGEEIIFHFAYSGGVEPAAISIVIAQDGEILAELSEFAETVTVTPAEVGNTVTTVTAEIIVTDCVGNTVTGVCEIPCAVRTRETESDWEKSTYVELTGEWPEDLIAVAETQLGYEESEIDFIVNAEGERQGYTRYGQWYGSTYGEWCAMFVSFDLNYAEIPESYFPHEANCEKWISALKACGLYEDAYGYEPEVGDLVFFDMDGDEESDHVGIVTNITDYSIETIEGNVYRDVRRCVYDRNDEVLYGYGCVLEAYETYLRDELDLDLEAGVGSLAIVTAESANLRAEADAESELVAQLPAETVVTVNASEQNRAEIWYQVSVGEQSGWLRSDLVEINYLIEEELVPAVADYDSLMNRIAELPFDGTEEHATAAADIAAEADLAYEAGVLTDEQYAEIINTLTGGYAVMTLEEADTVNITFVIDNSAYVVDNDTSHVRIESEELYQLYAESGMTTQTMAWEGQTGWYKVTGTGTLAQFDIEAGSTLSASGLDTPDVEIYNLTNTTLNNTYLSVYSWVSKNDEGEVVSVCGADTVFDADTTLYLQLYDADDVYYLDYVCCEECNTSISFATSSLYAHPSIQLGSAVSDEYIPKAAAVNSVFACDNTACVNTCRTAENGMVFDYWYLRLNDTTGDEGKVTFDSTVAITTDYLNSSAYGNTIKVYAAWTEAPETVTNLTFNDSTGVSLGSVDEVAYNTTIDELIAANLISAPAQANCEFIGWTYGDGSQIVDGSHKITASDTTYRAVYTATVYVKVPDVEGGNLDTYAITEFTVQTGQNLLTAVDADGNLISEALAIDSSIVNGYVFGGWKLEQGSDTPITGMNDFSGTTVIASVTLTAEYSKAITITLRYLSADDLDDNGSLDDYVIVATYYCKEGGNLSSAVDAEGNPASTEPPVVQGYTVNWYAGGWYAALYNSLYSDMVITGTATALPTVTFQYSVTGDDLGTATTNVATYRIPAENATLAETIAANTGVEVADAQLPECPLTMDTKYFSHWATADNVVATLDTVITADTVYEAVFADKVLVKFQYSYTDSDTNTVTTVEQAQCYAIPGKPLSAAMTELPTVEVPGMRFMGWCLNETEVTLDTVVTLAEGATEVVYTADLRETININFVYQDVLDSDNDEDCEDAVTYMTYTMLKNGEYTTALRTVVDADGNETVEYLTEIPEAPYFENYKFVEWIYVKGETSAPLEDLTVFNNADADINVTAVYEYNESHTVTFHDIDPDGNEKLHEGVESIDVLVPDGEMLADYLPEVALVDRQASDVIKWYTIDENNVKTEFNPNQTVTSDLELYTYTYRIVLTLSSETEATQTASLLDLFMPTAYAATVTPNGNQLIIEVPEGETLHASDFVIDGVDYTQYKWTDTSGNSYLLSSLIGQEMNETMQITLTKGDLVGDDSITMDVTFYVMLNDEWELVDTRNGMTLIGVEVGNNIRWCISEAVLEAVYSEYGFTSDMLEADGTRYFGYVGGGDDTAERIIVDVPNQAENGITYTGCVSDWYTDNYAHSVAIYYIPNGATGEPYTTALQTAGNSFYSVTVEDVGNLVYTDSEAAGFTQYVLDGGTADSVTLSNTMITPVEDMTIEWKVYGADGNVIEDGVTITPNTDGSTTTITFSAITMQYIIKPEVTLPDGAYMIVYDMTPDDSELEQIASYYTIASQDWDTVPEIKGEVTLSVIVSGDEISYTVLSPDGLYATTKAAQSSGKGSNSWFYATYTFQGWKVDDETAASVQPGAIWGTTDNNLATVLADLDTDGDRVITLTPDWSAEGTSNTREDTVSFWVNVVASNTESNMESVDAGTNNYSDVVFTTAIFGADSVELQSPNDAQKDVLILASVNDVDTAVEADSIIRNLDDTAFKGVTIAAVPTDAYVLNQLVEWMTTNTGATVTVDGATVTASDLTTENYTIRWYVLKYDGQDGWHIDGKLVPRKGKLTVTKTFYGDADAIASIVNNTEAPFSITVANVNTNYAEDVKTLTLSGTQADGVTLYHEDGSLTYTWVLDVTKTHTYKITENNYTAADTVNDVPMASLAEYLVTNSTHSSAGTWKTYTADGVEVTAVSYNADISYSNFQTVNLLNSYIPTSTLLIRKVDAATGEPLSGVSFELTSSGTAKDIELYQNGSKYYIAANHNDTTAEKVEDNKTVTVDSDGYLQLVGLKDAQYAGTYTLSEVSAPEGYTGIDDIIFTIDANGNLTLTGNNNATLVGTNTLLVTNSSTAMSVTVRKNWTDGSDKQVTLELWQSGVKMQDSKYTVVLDGITDDSETTAWEYTWKDLPLYVNGAPAVYTVLETWIGNSNTSDGISYDPNADTDGYEDYVVAIDSMVYRVWDEEANAYVELAADDISTASNVNALITVHNETASSSLRFRKTDATTGGVIAGAKFVIYSDAECTTVVAEATSDSEGWVVFENLVPGEYYMMKETELVGYQPNDMVYSIEVTGKGCTVYETAIDETTQTREAVGDALSVIPNSPIVYIDINVNKVSTEGGALEGAKFQLSMLNENSVYENVGSEVTTDENGEIQFTDLTEGTYKLTETEAPAGYYLSTTEIDFTINANGAVTTTYDGWDADTATFTVTNTPGMELPSTGGAGTYMFTIGGLLLMAASLLYGIGQRRKRERGDEI